MELSGSIPRGWLSQAQASVLADTVLYKGVISLNKGVISVYLSIPDVRVP